MHFINSYSIVGKKIWSYYINKYSSTAVETTGEPIIYDCTIYISSAPVILNITTFLIPKKTKIDSIRY